MECGIVGPPLSGKTTLFQLLTGQAGGRFDGHRREPARGVASVKDERLEAVAKVVHSRKVTPATMDYVDIPGVEMDDRHREPFPPRYLAELRAVDMLALVVRDFADAAIPHPSGSVNPPRDVLDASLEFIVSDLDIVNRRLERLARQHDPQLRREQELFQRCQTALEQETPLRSLEFTPDETHILRGFAFLSLKPLLVVVNLDESGAQTADEVIARVKSSSLGDSPRTQWVASAVGIELEISQLEPSERAPFLSELGFTLPALDRVVAATRELLGLITFITAGEKESRAWTLTAGSTALHAAEAVHEDIARGFIRAEVCRWDELVKFGSHTKVRDEGKLRLEGKNYAVQDGDVINVRFAI